VCKNGKGIFIRINLGITAWGGSNDGGTDAPSGKGYTKIYSTWRSFAALKADGSIIAWGRSSHGGTSAPSGSGYTNIYSTSISPLSNSTPNTTPSVRPDAPAFDYT
jgi:hypothetical protein